LHHDGDALGGGNLRAGRIVLRAILGGTVALIGLSLVAVATLRNDVRDLTDPLRWSEARSGNQALAVELEEMAAGLNRLQASLLVAESQGREARDAAGLVGPSPSPIVPEGSSLTPKGPLSRELRSVFASLRLARARSLTLCREYGEVVDAMGQNAERWASIPTLRPLYRAQVTSRYGLRRDPFTRRLAWHRGVDLVAPYGTPVHATAGGLVVRAGRASGYGRMVEIDHGNGLHTRYAHNSRLAVEEGIYVRRGQLLAYVGSSGRANAPHLHFEVRLHGEPVNPEPYLLPEVAPAVLAEVTLAE
jgi:murein DD-endopeptidase MepM/ murein hydrolase activator NlpD